MNNTTRAVINILSFNFYSKSFQSSPFDHFQYQIIEIINYFVKWLCYSKTSILNTTLKLKYPNMKHYLDKNKKKKTL